MKIFLIGMPGSGKSTLGRSVARRLGYAFADLDALITAQEGMSIPEIFGARGEDYFRQAEQTALHGTEPLDRVVIATGGGTPCFFDNMAWMKSHGIAMWLDVSPGTIAGRMNRNAEASRQRPLFAGKSKAEITATLAEMHRKRLPFYQLAQVRVREHEARPAQVVQKIKDLAG
jgi:shikimate kinase